MQKKPITIERIDAEVNGKVILPEESERKGSIKMIEEGNPAVPVCTYYGNVANIFEKSKFDVDIFLEKYPETRCLSKKEINVIHSYCETGEKYDFAKDTILGRGRSSCYKCIFKIEDGRWIVWKTDERRGFYQAKEFDNVEDACVYLISLQELNVAGRQCFDFFNNLLDSGMSNEEIEKFCKDFNYNISKSKIRNK